MSYTNGEANLLTILRATDYYNANNSSRANWKILDSGRKSYYVILKPGEEPGAVQFHAMSAYQITWTTVIQLWQKYTDETTTSTNLFAQVQRVIDAVQPNNRLDDTTDTIVNAEIISVSTPLERWTSDGGTRWLCQDITVQWVEQAAVTLDG